MKFLVTGSSGFIGYHVCKRLLDDGHEVVGIDREDNYYDINLKYERRILLRKYDSFSCYIIDLSKKDCLEDFEYEYFDYIIHLAAQPGVRYSISHPLEYLDNIEAFLHVLEFARYQNPHPTVLYASSSSVKGNSDGGCDNNPLSLYAATKKSCEVIASAYNHLYDIPLLGMRFFTVYGPYGRPDMAIDKFARSILDSKPIDVYNSGEDARSFTFIDDVVECIDQLRKLNWLHHTIVDIGNPQMARTIEIVGMLERIIGKTAKINFADKCKGDADVLQANTTQIRTYTKFNNWTDIYDGLQKTVQWLK